MWTVGGEEGHTELGGEHGLVIDCPLNVRQGEIDILGSRELAPLPLVIDPLELPVRIRETECREDWDWTYLFPGPVMSGHTDVVQNSDMVP